MLCATSVRSGDVTTWHDPRAVMDGKELYYFWAGIDPRTESWDRILNEAERKRWEILAQRFQVPATRS